MKRMLALFAAVLMLLSMTACQTSPKDDGKYVVGICQYITHPALDAATKGFKAALVDLIGAENVSFQQEDAAGDPSNCTSIINSLINSKVDLILANATPALQAAANATRRIPILGTSVTEYGVALGIDDFSGTVGGNVSGTSDLADLNKQAQMILDWCPDAKKVGLLYCSAEANSQYQVDKVQEYLNGKGIECKMFAFTDSNDLSSYVRQAADWSDAIYVPTDNAVAEATGVINPICLSAGVPVIAGEQGICSGCGIATMSIDYYELGYTTGKMAAKILKGEAKISEMPIEYAPTVSPKYNEENCNALNIKPLEGYEKIG